MPFAIPMLWKLGALAALIASLLGGFFALRAHYIDEGKEQAYAAVAARNKEAVDAVARNVSRVDECHARGWVWSQSARECVRGD